MEDLRILIVEDEPIQRLRLKNIFEEDGYAVDCVESAQCALEQARATPPDVILSDVMMPGMDGYELAMSIKGDKALQAIPIALQSSVFTGYRERLLAEAIGVDGYFDKDVESSELLAKVRAMAMVKEHGMVLRSSDRKKLAHMRDQVLSERVESQLREIEIERRRAHASSRQLQLIADAMPDLILEVNEDNYCTYVNKAYLDRFNGRWERVVGKPIRDVLGAAHHEKIAHHIAAAMAGEMVSAEEAFDLGQAGTRVMWIRFVPNVVDEGEVTGLHIIATDITERKLAEEEVAESSKYHKLTSSVNRLIAKADTEMALYSESCRVIGESGEFPLVWIGGVADGADGAVTVLAVSASGEGFLDRIRGVTTDELYAQADEMLPGDINLTRVHNDLSSRSPSVAWCRLAEEFGYRSAVTVPIHGAGRVVALLNIYSPQPNSFKEKYVQMLEVLARDIGYGISAIRLQRERDIVNDSLTKVNRSYRTLVKVKNILTNLNDETQMIKGVCHSLMESGSYQMVWFGEVLHDRDRSIKPLFSVGEDADYIYDMVLTWDNKPLGRGPAGTAAREKRTVVINDLTKVSDFQLWHECATQRGVHSLLTVPLLVHDKPLAILTLCSAQANAFYPEEIAALEEIACDLSQAISRVRQLRAFRKAEGELDYQRNLFEAVFRQIPESMIITDINHRMIISNSSMIRDFGYFPEEVYGETTEMLHVDPEGYLQQQRLYQQYESAGFYTPIIVEYRRKDGSTFLGETIISSFRDKDNQSLGHIMIVRDVSERLSMEKERGELELQLQQAQKMEAVGQLTGGIAHDFNNILASVLGYSELAIMRNEDLHKDEKMGRYLAEIEGASARARDIIAKLLAFSRTGSSERKAVSLQALIRETASLLQPTLSSSVELVVDVGEKAPEVLADGNQLHQVLMNLCINSRDAMSGWGTISIGLLDHTVGEGSCTSCGEKFNGNFVRLSICDTGSGISDEVLSKMFHPFFTTKEVGKGSGMGLAMVHGIIHDHGGHIEVETSHEGTCFNLYLPVAGSSRVGLPVLREQGSDTIVVIDDEALMVDFLQRFLQFNGYHTIGFTDPEEALEALLQEPLHYQLIITDELMPGINGREICSRVKEQYPEMPIILCSSVIPKGDAMKAVDCGFDAFVTKPIDSSHLLVSVNELVQASVVALPQ